MLKFEINFMNDYIVYSHGNGKGHGHGYGDGKGYGYGNGDGKGYGNGDGDGKLFVTVASVIAGNIAKNPKLIF